MTCVDASVAIKWLFTEEYSVEALALVTTAVRNGQNVVAPILLSSEVTNAIRRRMVRQGLTLADGQRVLSHFLTFPVTLMAMGTIYQDALVIADAFGLPAVYDAQYVALAQYLGSTLWTDDRRLLRVLGGKLACVKWIGDYVREGEPTRG